MPTFPLAFLRIKRTVALQYKKIFMTEFIHAPVASKEIGVFSKRDPIVSDVTLHNK